MIQALRTIDHSLDVPSQNNGLVVTWSKHVNIPPRGSNNTVQTHLWLLYSAFYYLCGSFFFFIPTIVAQLLLTVPYVCKSSAVSGKLSSELLYNSDRCWISFSNFYLSLYCISTHYSLFYSLTSILVLYSLHIQYYMRIQIKPFTFLKHNPF